MNTTLRQPSVAARRFATDLDAPADLLVGYAIVQALGGKRGTPIDDPWSMVQTHPEAQRVAEVQAQISLYRASGGRLLGGTDGLGRATHRRSPWVLFARGQAAFQGPSLHVAVVGSRMATPSGLARARALAEAVAAAGGVVVSGGARGVDQAAHVAAVESGGETLCVLGQPASDGDERSTSLRSLETKAPDRVLSVTPFGPWVAPTRHLFAARNHMIAALSDVVVVIEGCEGSGTRHTAAAARAMGVPVFAIPGSPDDPHAHVPNELLRTGARPYLPGAVGLSDLGLVDAPAPSTASLRPARASAVAPRAVSAVVDLFAPVRPTLSAAASACLDAVEAGTTSVDALAARLSMGVLLGALSELEIEGLVRVVGTHVQRVA